MGNRVEIAFLIYYQPGVAVSPTEVAVWGGTVLYLASLTDPSIARIKQGDEIHAAYPFATGWCLVNEISVTLMDQGTGNERARYDHDEIILHHHWSADRLLLEDLQGRRIALTVAEGGRTLMSQSARGSTGAVGSKPQLASRQVTPLGVLSGRGVGSQSDRR